MSWLLKKRNIYIYKYTNTVHNYTDTNIKYTINTNLFVVLNINYSDSGYCRMI